MADDITITEHSSMHAARYIYNLLKRYVASLTEAELSYHAQQQVDALESDLSKRSDCKVLACSGSAEIFSDEQHRKFADFLLDVDVNGYLPTLPFSFGGALDCYLHFLQVEHDLPISRGDQLGHASSAYR